MSLQYLYLAVRSPVAINRTETSFCKSEQAPEVRRLDIDPDPAVGVMDREPGITLSTGEQGVSEMGNRIYVGNLPFSADESTVKSLFEQNDRSVTEVKLITDRDTGRPRGFGFVEMANSEDADKAISELNGYTMDGRALTVNEARERSEGGGGGGGRRF
jgi:hypothetical protein